MLTFKKIGCTETSCSKSLKRCANYVIYFASILCFGLIKACLSLTFSHILWILVSINFYLSIFTVKYWGQFSQLRHVTEDTIVPPDSVTEINVQSNNPVLVYWKKRGGKLTAETKTCPGELQCELYNSNSRYHLSKVGAYLFYASLIDFNDLPLPRQPEQVIWALSHEESPRNVPVFMHEPALNLFNYSTTFSRYSDVPFPLQFLRTLETITSKVHFVETQVKNSLLKEIAPIIFIQSDCSTATERDAYVEKLMEFIKIDSYGSCLNNKPLDFHLTDDYLNRMYRNDTIDLIARYKFMIAIENGVCDDYVTEKFWRPIHLGVVPIYFGSPKIRDWFPNKQSAILIEDFTTPKIMSEHIKKLLRDDELYEKYLEHKTKGIITNDKIKQELEARSYQTDYQEIAHAFECFVCKKLHDRKNQNEVHVVTKAHYDCPQPISALTLDVNPRNEWVNIWKKAKRDANYLYRRVMEVNTNSGAIYRQFLP